jgi:uncharacterized protein involved in tolerance to divalent cations
VTSKTRFRAKSVGSQEVKRRLGGCCEMAEKKVVIWKGAAIQSVLEPEDRGMILVRSRCWETSRNTENTTMYARTVECGDER